MKEQIKDPQRLAHISDAIQNVFDFSKGKTLEDIRADKVLYFGIVKNIEIIGEASYMLTDEFKDAHPQTPWRTITNMRHTLVHGYYQISPEEVFYVIEKDLPPLKEQIEDYRKEMEK